MQDLELVCTYNDHKKSRINGICTNKNCDKIRPVCLICMKQYHVQHADDILDFDDFWKWRGEGLQLLEELMHTITTLEEVALLLRELIKPINIDNKFNLSSSTTVQINSEVDLVLQIKSFKPLLSKDLSQLNKSIQQIQNAFKLLKSQIREEISIEQFSPPLQPPQLIDDNAQPEEQIILQQQLLVKPQITENDINKIQFEFSKLDKYQKVTVQQQGNVAEGYGFCICDPAIPNTGITRAAFKIIKGNDIRIGVCQRDIIKQANYWPTFKTNTQGHGAYLIDNSGFQYSHHLQQIDLNQHTFQFTTNDIIIVVVNIENQEITWILYQSNKTYTMQFNLKENLSFCIQMNSYGSTVEIDSK